MRCEMAVAAHKPYPIPEDTLYLPMHVGAWRDPQAWQASHGRPWQRDDEGKNISAKNDTYCELTAHWWLWQHSQADALGLCHYRRCFAGRRLGSKQQRVLTHAQAEQLLLEYDIILPVKRHYWIETSASQYAHAHHQADLTVLRTVLAEMGDDRYNVAYDRVMQRRSGHRFNMLLARREVFDAYSAWLFGVLARVEAQLDISTYSDKDRRVFGYLAERLLDVWLAVNPQRIRELPVVYMESQHWPRKIADFLLRKIKATLGKRD